MGLARAGGRVARDGRTRLAGAEALEDRRLLAGNPADYLAPASFYAAGSVGYFSGRSAAGEESELFRTDGTTAGTYRVKDINPGSAGSNPSGFVAVGGTVYFAATDAANGREIWKTDGTEAGTVLVANIRTGANSANPQYLTAVGDIVYFSASDDTGDIELYRSDGTATYRVANINPTGSSSPADLTAVGGRLVFSAYGSDFEGSRELYGVGPTGTAALVADLSSTTRGSSPEYLTPFAGAVYFTTYEGTAAGAAVNGDLWRTDGTPAGTTRVAKIDLGTSDYTSAYNLAASGDRLYFLAIDLLGSETYMLWASDGTTAGTAPVPVDLAIDTYAWLQPVGVRSVMFLNKTPAAGTEPWVSDGTVAGTQLLADIAPGTASGMSINGTRPARAGGTTFFVPTLGGGQNALWRTDGTPAGTALVRDVTGGVGYARMLGALGSTALFTAGSSTSEGGLFRSDGTAAGTVRIYVAADAPAANAGGPYAVNEGGAVTLTGTGTTVSGRSIAAYEWDLDYDGSTFDVDATGATPAFSAAGLDGAASRTVGLRMRDDAGQLSAVAQTAVAVNNVAPTATFAAGPAVSLGQASTVSFSGAYDPSPADAANLRFSFDFNNDGDFADAGDVADSTSSTASFAFPAAGNYAVRGRVADDDGGATDYTAYVTVNPATPTPAVTRDVRAAADAYARGGTSAAKNFGSVVDLQVKRSADLSLAREAFLRFDLGTMPVKSTESAILRVYGRANEAGSVTVDSFAVAGTSWTETGLTYNSRPAVGTKQATKTVSGTTNAWVEFDVSAYVRAQRAAGATKVAFALKGAANSTPYATFASDEATANRPALRLKEVPVPAKTLRASADTYVRDGTYDATNYGSAGVLQVRKSATGGASRVAMLTFDLSSVATVSAATLRLFGKLESTAAASARVQAFEASTATWTESGTTWRNRPTATGASLGEVTVSGTTAKWYTLNLTAWLTAQKAAGKAKASLVLTSPVAVAAAVVFNSDEATGSRPELVVTG